MFARDLRSLVLCSVMLLLGAAHAQRRVAKSHSAKGPGAALFAQNCAACHGNDGRGGERAPNIATQSEVVGLSDVQLADILNKGILSAGMPSFGYLGSADIHALVRYLRTLQGITATGETKLPGDPRVGEAIFFGKASCSTCHMVNGRGGFMAADLSEYARGRTVPSIRAAIVHPDDNPGNPGRPVTIETVDGARYSGLVRSQDNFAMILQTRDGVFHRIARGKIQQMKTSEHSMMPQDYGTILDRLQMNDLISYLLQAAGPVKMPAVGMRGRKTTTDSLRE